MPSRQSDQVDVGLSLYNGVLLERNDVTAWRYGADGLQAPPMTGMPSTRYSETGYHVLSLHLPADRPIDCAPHALGCCRHVEVVDTQRAPERINDSIHNRRT